MSKRKKHTPQKQSQPKISVIIFSYNFENYLEECIESVLAQTLKPYEIIISDDHSTDRSWDIIQRYAKKHPKWIRAFRHKKNMGHVHNGAFARAKVRGELQSEIDGDDKWLPRKLELEWQALKKNPRAKAAYSNVFLTDEQGQILRKFVQPGDPDPPQGDVFVQAFAKQFFKDLRALYRNELIYREAYLEFQRDPAVGIYSDWDLKIRITAKYPVAYSGEALVMYRNHPGGIHHQFRLDLFDSAKRVVEKNLNLLSKRTPEEKQFIIEHVQTVLENDYKISFGSVKSKGNTLKIISADKQTNQPDFAGERLIFLISQPRAGSTMLQRILAGHSQIHTMAEPWLMLHPVYALRGREIQAEYGPRYAFTGLQDYLNAVPEGEEVYIQALQAMADVLYGKLLQDSGKRFFLDKTPRYYFIINELKRIFPQAKFIFLLRNPLSVLSSILHTWVKNNWPRLGEHRYDLLKAPQLLVKGINQLKEDCAVLNYENFVLHPQQETKALCNYLNIPFEEGMLNYGAKPVPAGRMGDSIGVERHRQPVAESLNKWTQQLAFGRGKMLAEVYLELLGDHLVNLLGYDAQKMKARLRQITTDSPFLAEEYIAETLAPLALNAEKLNQVQPILKKYLKTSFVSGAAGTYKEDSEEWGRESKINVYFQPAAGNTEKYIDVQPVRICGSPISAHRALQDYPLRDFGKGAQAALLLMEHVIKNKFGRVHQNKSDFWPQTVVLPVCCRLTRKPDNQPFSQLKAETLEMIDARFAAGEEYRRTDIEKYARLLKQGTNLGRPLYVSGTLLNYLMGRALAEAKGIYMLDGARRISAAALAHRDENEILLILHESEFPAVLPEKQIRHLKQKMNGLTWFKNYHSIPLLGLQGERTLRRFSLMDMNLLKNQTVLDFGCNIGQATLKAVQAGAKQVLGIEGMADTFALAQDIRKLSGFDNLHYIQVDFNDADFDGQIDRVFPQQADYSFFFSVFRTKELIQRERLFRYIIGKTRKGIFFEGHASAKIDTPEYYSWLFESFKVRYKFLGYSEGELRPLFYLPLQNKEIVLPESAKPQNKQAGVILHEAQSYPYRVSAIVSTYKSERFMEEKLKDLLRQTLGKQLEIIIIDSASPENEGAVVQRYLKKYDNIRYLRSEKKETVYQAWNRGIKIARGKYVTNSNTDDRLRKDALQVMADYLDAHPQTALVYGDIYITGYENMTFEDHIRTGYSLKPEFRPDIMLHGCHMGPQPMWRRAVHEQIGYFDERLQAAGDYEMWCRMASAGFEMQHLNQFFGLYLHNPAGIINRKQALADAEAEQVRQKYRKRFPQPQKSLPTGFYYKKAVEPKRYVNICMITYNRLEFTAQALLSILQHTRFPYVISVVDNGSNDGSKEFLQQVKDSGLIKNLVLLDENVGVAKASNLAWSLEPRALYYLKYDNDIIIKKDDWLLNMVKVAEAIPKAGIIGYNFERKSYPLTKINGLRVRVKEEGNLGGACVLISEKTRWLLGVWNEEYGLYSEEDLDYGMRVAFAGLLNIYMEDEDIGLHLPAGKAAEIDLRTYEARDGVEETQNKDYRRWKDDYRRSVLDKGIIDKNYEAYKNGQRPLFVASDFINHWNNPDYVPQKNLQKISAPLKISFLTNDYHYLACPKLRIVGPLEELLKNKKIKYLKISEKDENGLRVDFDQARQLDILIIQRGFVLLMTFDELMNQLGDKRPYIIYEFDDAFDRFPKDHPGKAYSNKMMPKFRDYIRNADLVTVSTEELRKYYLPLNSNIVVLPNCVNEKIWGNLPEKVKTERPVRILFSGTITHKKDLAAIETAIKRILKEYAEKVELIIWANRNKELEKIKNVKVINSFYNNYEQYAQTLKKMDVDFAVIPLADNEFNRAKSNIKWLEYSACKIPGIYSDIPAYRKSIEDGQTGFVVSNNENAWYEKIKFFIDHPQEREKIARQSFQKVWNEFTLRKNIRLWQKAYYELFNKDGKIYPFKLSVIILTWNRARMLDICLNSLFNHLFFADETQVIVGDNGSSDETARIVAKYPVQKYIFNEKNESLALYKRLFNEAEGEYIIILDDDVLDLPAGFDKTFLEYFAAFPEYGFLSLDVVQNVFTNGAKPEVLEYNEDKRQGKVIQQGDAGGWCACIPHTVFEKIGRLEDEKLNMAFTEDNALNIRVRAAGMKTGILKDIRCFHAAGPYYAYKFAYSESEIHKYEPVNMLRYAQDYIPAETDTPVVSVIIPLFNKLDYTKRCLKSIFSQTEYPDYEVILIDNGSTDGSREFIRAQRKKNNKIRVILNEKNEGFARANNRAARQAKGQFLLFLNNDTQVTEGWLKALVNVAQDNPLVGAVGSKLLYPDGAIQHAGIWLLEHRPSADPLLAVNSFAKQPGDFPSANKAMTYQALSAACILVDKSLFEEIKGFDQGFWNGYEDVDLCLRMGEKGRKIVYEPDSVVIHYESQSGKERFSKVKENIDRLHKKWLGKVTVDYIVETDKKIIPTRAGKIAPYKYLLKAQNEKIKPLVSIVLLTFNALEYTKQTYESIRAHTRYPYEIIFVDNASTDGTQNYLKTLQKKDKKVTVVFNKKNKGFSAGNNQGAKKAKGEYVLFLNNDVLVAAGWLENLVAALESDDGIAMVGPITNYISGLQMVKNVPYTKPNDFPAYAQRVAQINKNKITPRRRIAGFAMLMPKIIFQEIGGFDEAFGSGNFEDDDLCLRVKQEGFAIMVHEGVYIHHFGSRTFIANQIDYLHSLDKREARLRKKWPDLNYEHLLEFDELLTDEIEQTLEKAAEIWKQGQQEQALSLYQQVFQQDPLNVEALLGLAVLYNQNGQFDEALYLLNKLLRLEPENALALNQSGVALAGNGDWQSAEKAFVLAIKKDPQLIDAQRNYGRALIENGEYKSGIATFQTILHNHPEDISTLLYMTQLFIETEHYEQARSYVEQALGLNKRDTSALRLKKIIEKHDTTSAKISQNQDSEQRLQQAGALLEKGKLSQAEKIYQTVLRKNKNDITAQYGLALIRRIQEDFEAAQELLQAIIRFQPDFTPAFNQLGTMAMVRGNFEQALEYLKRSLRLDPKQSDVQNYISDVLIRMGHYKEGVQILNIAEKQHPENTGTLLRKAEIFLDMNRQEQAIAYFKKILELEPENESARKYMREMA